MEVTVRKLSLYFAHNFNNREEFRKLELQLERELNIELFNPFYDDPSRKEEMEVLDGKNSTDKERIKYFRDPNEEFSKLIVKRDLQNIAKCDGLFTIILKPSIGTTIEICNAVLMRKPIYIVSKDYKDHPWIKVYADFRFSTIEEFKQHIKNRNGNK